MCILECVWLACLHFSYFFYFSLFFAIFLFFSLFVAKEKDCLNYVQSVHSITTVNGSRSRLLEFKYEWTGWNLHSARPIHSRCTKFSKYACFRIYSQCGFIRHPRRVWVHFNCAGCSFIRHIDSKTTKTAIVDGQKCIAFTSERIHLHFLI